MADQLSVQQLRTFCRVYTLQSYAATAKELDLSVPAVWEQVQSLQVRYRTDLFERRGRRIFPTQAADQLFLALQPVLAGLDSSFELLHDETLRPNQPITLVTGVRMVMEELAPTFQRFQSEFPNVRLRLLHRDNLTAQQLVAAGDADLAITIQPGPGQEHDAIHIASAYPVEYLAIAPRRHPLSRAKRFGLQQIVKHPLLIGHTGTHVRRLFDQALHRAGLYDQVHIVAETDNSAFTIACVKAGMGVGILAGNPEGALCESLLARSLRDELGDARIVCQWKEGRQLAPTLARLVELIRAARAPAA